jgi:hypothetical protein
MVDLDLTTFLILFCLLFLNCVFYSFDDVKPLDDLAKHNIIVIQPGTCFEGDVELRGVRIFFSGVGHRDLKGLVMFVDKVLIREILPVNRLPSRTISIYKISSLNQRPLNNPMEKNLVIMQRFSTSPFSFFSSAKTPEVLRRLWHIWIEFNLDPAYISQLNFNVKEHNGEIFL